MLNLGTLLHIAAAIATVVFGGFLLKYQKDLALLKLCLYPNPVSEEQAVVRLMDRGRLIKFLTKFLNIESTGLTSWQTIGVGRVDPGALVLLHLACGIKSWHCRQVSGQQEQRYYLDIDVQNIAVNEDLRQRLRRALGKSVVLEVK